MSIKRRERNGRSSSRHHCHRGLSLTRNITLCAQVAARSANSQTRLKYRLIKRIREFPLFKENNGVYIPVLVYLPSLFISLALSFCLDLACSFTCYFYTSRSRYLLMLTKMTNLVTIYSRAMLSLLFNSRICRVFLVLHEFWYHIVLYLLRQMGQ